MLWLPLSILLSAGSARGEAVLDEVRVLSGDGHDRILLVLSAAPGVIEGRSVQGGARRDDQVVVRLGDSDLGAAGPREVPVEEDGLRRIELRASGADAELVVHLPGPRDVRTQLIGETAVLVDLLEEGRGIDPALPSATQLRAWLDDVGLSSPTAAIPPAARGRIVVDAGHGGWDHGAVGLTGTREADIALQIARRTARILEDDYGFEVLLCPAGGDGCAGAVAKPASSLDQSTVKADAGAADGSVLVGMNATHLLHRSAASGGALRERRLPMTFASPVVFKYDTKGDYILGPTSHDRTVSLAVSPADSSLVAVTGWASVLDNEGDERVFMSTDAGATWNDVTANLAAATATVGKVRPSALVLVPTGNGRETALVVGAANGAYATVVQGADGAPRDGRWQRLGPCSALPLVMVAGLSYDGESDTIAAATMGRGVYLMKEASKALGAL